MDFYRVRGDGTRIWRIGRILRIGRIGGNESWIFTELGEMERGLGGLGGFYGLELIFAEFEGMDLLTWQSLLL